MGVTCQLCNGGIQPPPKRKYRPPNTCLAAGCVLPTGCWQKDPNPLVAYCAQSQRKATSRLPLNLDLTATLRGLGEAARIGDAEMLKVLQELTPEQRHTLLVAVVPPLSVHLAKLLATAPHLEVRRKMKILEIPPDLPAGISGPLKAYEQKLIRKYRAKLKAGHSPSNDYVRRGMVSPLRYAKYLHEQGIHQWDAAQKKDLVRFLELNPNIKPPQVSIFLRFLQDARPWRDPRGSRATKGRAPKALVPPEIIPPEELNQFLAKLDGSVTEAEFLIAWLVARLGLFLRTAYRMTLHQVRVNDSGRIVIKPADVWVELPKDISKRFDALIEGVFPGWKNLDPHQSAHLTFFNRYVVDIDKYPKTALKMNVRVLRASALYAAMMRGYVDRVTLHHSTGASFPYLATIETLLSVDMHQRLAADFVELRNSHILGEVDE